MLGNKIKIKKNKIKHLFINYLKIYQDPIPEDSTKYTKIS